MSSAKQRAATRVARATLARDKNLLNTARQELGFANIEAAIAASPTLSADHRRRLAARLQGRVGSVEEFEPKTWPLAQQSALAEAGRAVMLAEPSTKFGYAVLSAGAITVEVFSDGESMRRELAAIYTAGSTWGFPLSWEAVLFFEPEKPLRLHLVVELDDEDER